MNEIPYNLSSKLYKDFCLTCLRSTTSLYTMSCEYINEYSMIISTPVDVNSPMMICNICNQILRRLLRFKRQCQEAVCFLQDVSQKGSKSLEHHSSSLENLTINLKLSDVQIYSYPITIQEASPLCDYGDDNVEICEMDGDNVNDSEEELPLHLLKKRKKKKEIVKQTKKERQEERTKRKVEKSNGKIKKELKAGFTSRMVQETQEYVVIKLTRDEVLLEMSERAKSESYQRYPFKCEKCVKGFNFNDVLQTHLEKHDAAKGSFQCDMCSQYCPSAVSLRGHIKSHTTRYKCKLCDHVRLSRQHLLEHHASQHTEHPASYTCNTCSFNTNKRTVIQRHVRRHAASTPRACHTCGKLFQSIHSLRVHAARHEVSSKLQCPECPRTFVYLSLLNRHARSVHERRDYYCVECDLQFRSQESLRLHFKKAVKHRDTSTYKHECPDCTQRFFSRGALAAHASSAHAAPRAHACTACRRRYCSRDALRSHVWRAHRDTNVMDSRAIED